MNVVWLLYKLRMIANHAQGLKPGSLWVLYAALEGPLFHGDARRLGFLRPCFFRSRSFAPPELVRQFHLLTHGLRRGLPSFAALRLGRCYISGLECPLLAIFPGCIMHRG